MEHKLLGGEPWFNSRPQEKLKWKHLLLTSPGGSGHRATQGSGGRVYSDRDTGAEIHAFIRVCW